MASWDIQSEGGGDSAPSWQGSVGTGMYLTARVKEELRKRLDVPNTSNWKHLAIELEIFTDMEMQLLETQYSRPGGSPTMELLRVYEQRMGGVDEDNLKRCFMLIGRNDILTDLQDFLVDGQGNPYPLVETRERKPVVPRQSSTPSPSTCSASQSMPTSQSQPSTVNPSHQDIVINGTVHITVQKGSIVSHVPGTKYVHSGSGVSAPENGISHPGGVLPPENGAVPLSPNDHGGHVANSDEVRIRSTREDQTVNGQRSTVRPNSDPVQRKVPSIHNGGAHVPRNQIWTNSDPSFDGSQHKDAVCVVHHEDPVVPSQREEESIQQRPDYSPLISVEIAKYGSMPSPVAQESCFVISTIASKDMKLFDKIHQSLRRKNLEVYSVHAELPLHQLYSQFYKASFVVVVYTRTYEAEIKTERSLNGDFFKKIKEEYKRNGNFNRRFVPVFDALETELMPNALLRCESTVQKKAHELLTPCNSRDFSPHQSPRNYPAPQPWNNLSPPSPVGTTMNDRSAMGGQRSQSAPHIVCESHTHPACDQPKPKDKKNFKFWKKGK